jgi:hypothetical protein
MKKLALLFILVLTSCSEKKYKYEITKEIFYGDSLYDAIWYVDTFEFDGDTIFYFNSDSSKVIIHPPYNIKETK